MMQSFYPKLTINRAIEKSICRLLSGTIIIGAESGVPGGSSSSPPGIFSSSLNHLNPPDNWTNYALNATGLMLTTYVPVLNEAGPQPVGVRGWKAPLENVSLQENQLQ